MTLERCTVCAAVYFETEPDREPAAAAVCSECLADRFARDAAAELAETAAELRPVCPAVPFRWYTRARSVKP